MSAIAAHVVTMRQRVCPRTSYATSGSAASTLCCVVESSLQAQFDQVAGYLRKSGEFEVVLVKHAVDDLEPVVNGNAVVIYGCSHSTFDRAVEVLLARGRTKLVIWVKIISGDDSMSLCKPEPLSYSQIRVVVDGFSLTTCFNYRKALASATERGFNGQPSVQSGTQFKFLWSPSTPQLEEGKDRVLQRLADKTLHQGAKLTAAQWEVQVRSALSSGLDDFGVYSLIRQKTLGTTLAQDLEAQVLHGTSSSISSSGSKAG